MEREEYAKVPSASPGEGKERGGEATLLERILDRNNLNGAYKRVKRNHKPDGGVRKLGIPTVVDRII